MPRFDIRSERLFPSGATECSSWVVDNFGEAFRFSMTYMGYPKREAFRLFRAEIAERKFTPYND